MIATGELLWRAAPDAVREMNNLQEQITRLTRENANLKKQLSNPRPISGTTRDEKKLAASLKTLEKTLKMTGRIMSVRDLYEHFKRGKVFKKNNRKENFHQWAACPTLFLLTAKLLTSKSEPVMAADVLNSAFKVAQILKNKDLEMKVQIAQAKSLADMMSTEKAIAILKSLYDEGKTTEAILSLYGRCFKDLAEAHRNAPAAREKYLEQAFDKYLESFKNSLRTSYYTGINAAAVALLRSKRHQAQDLAKEVIDLCSKEEENYWVQATLGEAYVINEQWDKASENYAAAIECGGDQSQIWSTRRQFRLLARQHSDHHGNSSALLGTEAGEIDSLFKIPNVIVLLCNIASDYSVSKCLDLDKVTTVVEQKLVQSNAGFVYLSAFPGVDLLCAQAVLRQQVTSKVELYIVLPCPQDMFRKQCVASVEHGSWLHSFDTVVNKATDVVIANDLTTDGMTPINYQYCSYLLAGLAGNKARIVGTDLKRMFCPQPMVSKERRFADPWVVKKYWKRGSFETFSLPLVAQKHQAPTEDTLTPLVSGKKYSLRRTGPPQVIKAILFADVKGYSKLQEHEVFYFVKHVFGQVAELIRFVDKDMRPIVKNTWGDAFYFVFDTVDGGGKFALLMRDLFNNAQWAKKNLPSTLAIRISMHAAPVFPCVDAVLEEANYTGVHTSRGARIEPITVPGSVYCSRAFACLTTAMNVSDFDCPFIGNVPLAKGYGMLPIHVVAWKDEGQLKGLCVTTALHSLISRVRLSSCVYAPPRSTSGPDC